jgi:hypothetical protein
MTSLPGEHVDSGFNVVASGVALAACSWLGSFGSSVVGLAAAVGPPTALVATGLACADMSSSLVALGAAETSSAGIPSPWRTSWPNNAVFGARALLGLLLPSAAL